jgi:hypothetical protein
VGCVLSTVFGTFCGAAFMYVRTRQTIREVLRREREAGRG